MKKLLIILFTFVSWFANAQDYDFQELCVACAEANGYYCGDDPANWTQYAPMGCVQNGWINDEWEDCVDASDENGAVPTLVEDCAAVPPNGCDTIYVDVPVVEYIYETDTLEVPFYVYETIIQFDTIIETEFITNIVIDTIVDVQFDTIYNTEYIDCDTGMPCGSSIQEIVDKSSENSVIYNLQGQAIKVREGLYIENGKIYYKK